MEKLALKKKRIQRRKYHIKNKIRSKKGVLRLCVFRSNKHLYAQIIDDEKAHTLVAASTLSGDFTGTGNCGNIAAAKELGKLVAQKAAEKGIKEVVFDRNGFLYHGRIKEFADSARENGLVF